LPPSRRLELRTESSPELNPDPAGRPLSVVLQIYQLKDADAFRRLDFTQAAGGQGDDGLPGPASLARSERVLLPGSRLAWVQELHPEARLVGLVALYRAPERGSWRCLVDLDRLAAEAAAPLPRRSRGGSAAAEPLVLALRAGPRALALAGATGEPLPVPPGAGEVTP
jgi:type VI secretion system VasD/TssJ family lipoprotein